MSRPMEVQRPRPTAGEVYTEGEHGGLLPEAILFALYTDGSPHPVSSYVASSLDHVLLPDAVLLSQYTDGSPAL